MVKFAQIQPNLPTTRSNLLNSRPQWFSHENYLQNHGIDGIFNGSSVVKIQMKTGRFSWHNLRSKFMECLRDDRGIAMTEYLIITSIMVPAAIYLIHPDNGFYSAVRAQYNLTAIILTFPGP
jgi:hypothetical protein